MSSTDDIAGMSLAGRAPSTRRDVQSIYAGRAAMKPGRAWTRPWWRVRLTYRAIVPLNFTLGPFFSLAMTLCLPLPRSGMALLWSNHSPSKSMLTLYIFHLS